MDEETVSLTSGLTSSINHVNSSRLLSNLILDQAESKRPLMYNTSGLGGLRTDCLSFRC